MPSTTPNRQYPYPLGPDPIDTAGDIERLAKKLDTDVNGVNTTATTAQTTATTAQTTANTANTAANTAQSGVNAINSELGPNPSGTYANVELLLRQMSTRYNNLPDQLTVMGARQGVTTDSGSAVRIYFPYGSGFSSIPTVVICDASYGISIFHLTLVDVVGTNFLFTVARNDGSGFPSNSLVVSWMAIGTQVR